MAIRVGIVGTGNAGRLALRQLIDDSRFELVARSGVSTPERPAGRGRTDRNRRPDTGIIAALGLDHVVAARPDCVVYTAMGDTRPIGRSTTAAASSTPASTWSAPRRAACSIRGV